MNYSMMRRTFTYSCNNITHDRKAAGVYSEELQLVPEECAGILEE